MKKLLILSDMHLGRDCNEITGFKQERPNQGFDRAFIDLLDVYTSGREFDWRLIIGGDFIDFMEVVVVPTESGGLGQTISFEVTDEEREFGLGSEAERVLVKLERTMAFHRDFFIRLAQFVRDGGELVLIRGNHDVEFFWSKVQRVFRQNLANLAYREAKLDVDEAIELRSEFHARLSFEAWFYYEKNRIYLEHGHQYDTYCSFDHWLHPVSPSNPRRIDTPASLFAMRYFVNILSDFSPHNTDYWGWSDYIGWLRAKGVGDLLYIIKMALGTIYRLMEYAIRWSLGQLRGFQAEHQKAMHEMASAKELPIAKLKTIDHLHHVPVSRNLPELMRLIFLDRILLVAGTAFLIVFLLLILPSGWVELLASVSVLALSIKVNQLLAPRRFFLPGPKQAQAAKKIARILEVPLIVMGHSHRPRKASLGGDKLYLNTGCWLPGEHTSQEHRKGPMLCHLVIEGTNNAELRVFDEASKDYSRAEVEEEQTIPDLAPIPVRPSSS
jgi:UDP-2,3-diacylglucosamine pyrophosphatase LpxH